ncbi:FAD-dependent oxidoreductase [Bradyrhizobium sp. 186]|uniref:FAD-dependent oxidoreductase n=1 Tax=Bradyrhizobium sp. 186 TaxID=2782654 RepID=UPI002000CB24|nr:FAD-dependent oxidoreductase [Bradyrhizobium sp. 186]
MAASELVGHCNITLFEARDRFGGRVFSKKKPVCRRRRRQGSAQALPTGRPEGCRCVLCGADRRRLQGLCRASGR